MLVGYARTSTIEQEAGLEAQLRDLLSQGCEKIFQEQVSSVAKRGELDTCLEFLREGDALVVTRLDRLARSVPNLIQIIGKLEDKKVGLKILDLGIDTQSPQGRLVVTLLGAIAEFERALMLEQQREGIARARKDGRYKGRKATAMAKATQIKDLKDSGVGPKAIAEIVGVSRASVYRALRINS